MGIAVNVEILTILASFTVDDDLIIVLDFVCLMTIIYIDDQYLDMLDDVLKKHFENVLNYELPQKRSISQFKYLLFKKKSHILAQLSEG